MTFLADCFERALRIKVTFIAVVIISFLSSAAIGIQLTAGPEPDAVETPLEAHQKAVRNDYELSRQYAENGDVNAMVKMGCYHMNKGDFDTAKPYLIKAADKDDAKGMFYLGDYYRFKGDTAPGGSGKVYFYTRAMEQYKQAGEHGQAQAYLLLGCTANSGKGLKRIWIRLLIGGLQGPGREMQSLFPRWR